MASGTIRLGIDFGTSSTVAVLALPGRDPRPLLFDGSPLLPSAVGLDPTGRLVVGRDALHAAIAAPGSVERYPKRCVDDGTVLLGDTELTVVQLFAAVLGRVLDEATRAAGEPPGEVAVTHPAAWGSERRALLRQAVAPSAALLVPEPVAAAYHLTGVAAGRLPDGGTTVVYDFGAGTFDATAVRRDGDAFTILATQGRPDSGGLDIDAAIVAHLRTSLPDAAAWARLEAPETAADRRARAQLWDNVRTGKESLTRAGSTLIHVPGVEADVPLGREELDALAAPVLARSVDTTRAVLAEAGAEVSTILLVGGASRMPAVATALHRAFGVEPLTLDQPELAVAEGSLRAEPSTVDLSGDWPAVTPLPIRSSAEARPRRTRLLVAAGTGLVLAGVVAAVALAERPSTPLAGPLAQSSSPGSAAPSVPVSPSPSYPAEIDPCLLGRWRATSNANYGLIDGMKVQYRGGGGHVHEFRADGTLIIDYDRSEPNTAVYKGSTWTDVQRGQVTMRWAVKNGQLNEAVVSSSVNGRLTRDGKYNNSGPSQFELEPATYVCTPKTLLQSSTLGNWSSESVRID
ncbi:Hsp70 family protein [Dactylosporangium sp. CA-233914]|uniref:Hsp70 family protein n=1 Tax=Dactylosporangium sp. CA-233914 TaxID=3239934 RepID=UPI003D8EC53A